MSKTKEEKEFINEVVSLESLFNATKQLKRNGDLSIISFYLNRIKESIFLGFILSLFSDKYKIKEMNTPPYTDITASYKLENGLCFLFSNLGIYDVDHFEGYDQCNIDANFCIKNGEEKILLSGDICLSTNKKKIPDNINDLDREILLSKIPSDDYEFYIEFDQDIYNIDSYKNMDNIDDDLINNVIINTALFDKLFGKLFELIKDIK